MNIFVVSRGYPTSNSPQWGCFEKDQAEALANVGHKVTIISYDGRFRWFWRKPGFTVKKANGIVAVNLFVLPSVIAGILGKRFRRFWERWQLLYVYKKAVKISGEPDILYSHYLFLSYVALELKRNSGIPLVAIEHWSEVNKEVLHPLVQKYGEEVYNSVDALIVVANSLKNSIKKHFSRNSIVVHNLVGKEFCYVPKNISNKLLFVSTGSLIKRKGYDTLIEAFLNIDLPKDCWELNIIGDGQERYRLQKQIDEAGLSENIHLLGQKEKKDIVNILQNSDVFVLPSRNENFSVAVLEALACGLPVIASDCGGIRECINDKNGLIYPVDNIHALSIALKHMINCYSEYNKKEIAEDCQNKFSPDVIALELTNVFSDVVKNIKRC